MKRLLLAAALMASSTLVPSAASAKVWLATGGKSSKPYGHMEYCAKNKRDCRAHAGVSSLAKARMSTLRKVNVSVNRAIKPMSDQKLHGKREVWTANARAGDCEDYVLAKRNRLLRSGFKPGHLRIAVGNRMGERHAVLVVRTSAGDMVLDNMTDAVLPVNKSRMRISKIQSPTHAGEWVRVTGKTRDPKRIALR